MCSHRLEPAENKPWVRTVRCMVVLFSPLGDPWMLFFNFCARLKFTSDSIWKKCFSKKSLKPKRATPPTGLSEGVPLPGLNAPTDCRKDFLAPRAQPLMSRISDSEGPQNFLEWPSLGKDWAGRPGQAQWSVTAIEAPLHPRSCSLGFPGGADGKESACRAGDLGKIPGSGRSPGEVNGYPLQYSSLENSMDREARWTAAYRITKGQTKLNDWTT